MPRSTVWLRGTAGCFRTSGKPLGKVRDGWGVLRNYCVPMTNLENIPVDLVLSLKFGRPAPHKAVGCCLVGIEIVEELLLQFS